jgi:hypothetical protein
MAGKLLADTISAAITMTAPTIQVTSGYGTIYIDSGNGLQCNYGGAVSTMNYGRFQVSVGSAIASRQATQVIVAYGSGSGSNGNTGSARTLTLTDASGGSAIALASTGSGASININNGYISVNSTQVIDSFGRLRQSYTAESIYLGSIYTAGWFAAYDIYGNYRGKIPLSLKRREYESCI